MSRTKKHLTKQERYWISQYENARFTSVDSAYSRPSETKRQIEADIIYRMKHDFDGSDDYRILSHNGFHFSCAFTVRENDNIFLVVCTPSRWYNFVPIITVDSETGEIKNWIDDYDYLKF